MKIEEKAVGKFVDALYQMFRAGDKWVAWEVYEGPSSPRDLISFRSIVAANKFCDIHSGEVGADSFYYRFMPIINVLRSLTSISTRSQFKTDTKRLEEAIRQYPIEAYGYEESLVRLLSDGDLHPVNILQQIVPNIEINSYLVIEHHYPTEMACDFCHSSITHGSFTLFQEAQDCFDQLVERFDKPGIVSPEIKLVGKIKGQELALNYEDFPHRGTGVLFRMANASWNTGERKYEVECKNEPDQIIDIYLHKMAKFNHRKSAIEFFDGSLNKVLPYARIDYMDFDHLSSKPVTITNPLRRAVSRYDYLQPVNLPLGKLKWPCSI